jgi:general stress protein YciG
MQIQSAGRKDPNMIANAFEPFEEDEEQKNNPQSSDSGDANNEKRTSARGTAAMDAETRQEVARKGGLAVSRNRQHMAEIGRKGGQAVSKNREHMAKIGRKGGAASRGSGKTPAGSEPSTGNEGTPPRDLD